MLLLLLFHVDEVVVVVVVVVIVASYNFGRLWIVLLQVQNQKNGTKYFGFPVPVLQTQCTESR